MVGEGCNELYPYIIALWGKGNSGKGWGYAEMYGFHYESKQMKLGIRE